MNLMSKEIGRTVSAKKNLVIGTISKVFLLAATFLVRTLFIRILGAEYTGINSLFTNLLSILNLAELGMGSVFIYELYKPLKEQDNNLIAALVSLFKKIYFYVILAIALLGILLIPFLKYIVHSTIDIHNIYIYYIVYLIDSISSYLAVHRSTLIEADQKRYVTNLVEIVCKFFMYGLQSLYLILKKDFLGYLIIQVVFTLIKNIALHIIASRMYPYLNANGRKYVQTNVNALEIFKNVKATFITKIAGVILNQTDSIIISMLFGTVFVGYYSNYYMLIVYINSIYFIITSSLEASIGNLNADYNEEKSRNIYNKLFFLITIVNSLCVSGFICVVQDFIRVWIGESYLQSMALVIALSVTFYLQQSMSITYLFRQTFGMFTEVKIIYLIMAILNVVLSFVLGKAFGVAGVAFATGLSRLVTVFWYEGKLVFSKFGAKTFDYIKQQLKSAICIACSVLIALRLCILIPYIGLLSVVVKGCVAIIIALVVDFIFYRRSNEWLWAIQTIMKKVKLKKQ